MARQGLRQELPSLFRKTQLNYDRILVPNLKIGYNGGTQYVDLVVQRIEKPDSIRGMILFVFNEVKTSTQEFSTNAKTGKHSTSGRSDELEIELKYKEEELQSLREEMQTSQEELKSTNEELQSTNEELQSTNEELTTSKEEMQSLNEELQTVNIELQSKVNDYLRANDDMKNLLNSTEIATLFLDKDLNIRRYTDSATNIIKLRPADIGRPFTDLVSNLNYPDIDDHARKVIRTLTTIESAISTNDKRWFTVRIMPYRTVDDRIDGLVLTFSDISLAKNTEFKLNVALEELERIKNV